MADIIPQPPNKDPRSALSCSNLSHLQSLNSFRPRQAGRIISLTFFDTILRYCYDMHTLQKKKKKKVKTCGHCNLPFQSQGSHHVTLQHSRKRRETEYFRLQSGCLDDIHQPKDEHSFCHQEPPLSLHPTDRLELDNHAQYQTSKAR